MSIKAYKGIGGIIAGGILIVVGCLLPHSRKHRFSCILPRGELFWKR
jgi:hypothetical protein